MNKPVSAVVIVGCGHIGTLVAQQYLQQDRSVHALVRSTASAAALHQIGINAEVLDLSAPVDRHTLPLADSELFYFAPPPGQGREDSHMQHFLAALLTQQLIPRRIVYISTTGVYGDCQGRWIDESEPVKPAADRAYRRLDAEQQLQAFAERNGAEAIILRVAGIYGPNKLPLQRLQQQLPVVAESEAPFTNRIHADDLVQIAMQAMRLGQHGGIYHACDSQPGTMTDYFKQVAKRAGLPAPPEISLAQAQQQLSAGMLSYMQESRRLSNARTLRELQVSLRYPTLQDGLDSCFKETAESP
ncbi:MAG: SDR family oxidoreductase [Chromatiales bacterium]|jgi:nucleoside-diphosphate-sugar epimerase